MCSRNIKNDINYVFDNKNSQYKDLILNNLHNLFILITPYSNKKKYNDYILGFILINTNIQSNEIQYIDFIDTIIKKHNITHLN